MKPDQIRSIRINALYTKALTGKYTWDDLTAIALKMGVSKKTADNYIETIYNKINSI